MINGFLLFIVSIAYFGLLFAIAYFGDQHKPLYSQKRKRLAVYSLSLGVYCTSWTFYGAVGSASDIGLGFFPIYLGPILLMIFGAPLLARLIRVSKRHNTTSIADFIATRYGKSQFLAVLVTLIALLGVLPYIALQLKAVSMGYQILTTGNPAQSISSTPLIQDTALYVAVAMGLFTILFGTRHIDATEHHHGLIQAIAFESIVKLLAFIAVGLMVSFYLFDGFSEINLRLDEVGESARFSLGAIEPVSFITQTILAALAIICLPRQFHVTVVENYHPSDIYTARWVLPLYLILLTLFVVPIAASGILMYPDGALDADTYVLSIPLAAGLEELAVLAFIGGASAATGMVIVSTVSLSTMVCNEMVVPLLLRIQALDLSHKRNVQFWLLTIRRIAIFVTLFAAYGYYRVMGDSGSLAAIGLLSFVAVAQFAPVLFGGLIWRSGNRQGAIAGLLAGLAIWLYCLLTPTLLLAADSPSALLQYGLFGFSWLRPQAMFGLEGLDLITHGALLSLGANIGLYYLVSSLTSQRLIEKIQVASFLESAHDGDGHHPGYVSEATVEDITVLAERFLGAERTMESLKSFSRRHRQRLIPSRVASQELIRHVEKQLASTIGSSTARIVLKTGLRGQNMQIEDVVSIVDEASQVIKFNRELLQAAIENMNLGVSVVDADLNLVAWNTRYVEIFNYPAGFVRVGRPVADLLRYNLLMGHVPARKAQTTVNDRIELMRSGEAHEYERQRPDGSVILIQGSPMPGGGFVTTFSDITGMRSTEQALKETNTYLEQRVRERTEELSQLNTQLEKAKSTAEKANVSKTRFLASASHDLLQPLNAARLFTSALASKVSEQGDMDELVSHIDSSLNAAEEILSTLLDISKLDAGAYEPHITTFNLNELFSNLKTEFSVIAADKGLTLDCVPSNVYINSDHQLLRRVIQNLLTNAIRYTNTGRVLFGARRIPGSIRIEVWDTGPGIPAEQRAAIFEEFKRLSNQSKDKKGLGLGLAIVDRICKRLGYPLKVRSWPGHGSCFTVTLERVPAPAREKVRPSPAVRAVGSLTGTQVLCIDNEPAILEGMRALLMGWGCEVTTATSPDEAMAQADARLPEIILADYQLDEGENGLDTMDKLQGKSQGRIPGILITAVNTEEIKQMAKSRGYQILHKPVKPAALRAMINKQMRT